jgi:hypothetical protein
LQNGAEQQIHQTGQRLDQRTVFRGRPLATRKFF